MKVVGQKGGQRLIPVSTVANIRVRDGKSPKFMRWGNSPNANFYFFLYSHHQISVTLDG